MLDKPAKTYNHKKDDVIDFKSFHRRDFVKFLASIGVTASSLQASPPTNHRNGAGVAESTSLHPLAITMWDFSWLERRWPGAGYEDWDLVLDELKTRGYDSVRIDAYPHLVAQHAHKEWELLPCWNQQDWGSPALNRVRVQPSLNQFIRKCADRELRVGLSTWFREDSGRAFLDIKTPAHLGQIWKTTLDTIAEDDLLEHVLFVDLCNEWPLQVWTPFLPKESPRERTNPEIQKWMTDSLAVLRESYSDIPLTFSFTGSYTNWQSEKVSPLDFLELHIWMVGFSDFYQRIGYRYERFDPIGYENVVREAEKLYHKQPEYWKACLQRGIDVAALWSKASRKPLITTECWGLVDYKDWPLLHWDWIKDLCEYGTLAAARTGRWAAIATSNFCGPQFVGMWRDESWHQRLTRKIHSASIAPDLVPVATPLLGIPRVDEQTR